MKTSLRYTRLQIALHWVIAALVVFQIVAHDGIEQIWSDRMDGDIPNVATPNPHVVVGFLIMALMLWRLFLRFRLGVPALPATEHPLLRAAATTTHVLFYVLLLGMPISGAVAWFVGIPQPAAAHGLAGNLLIALVIVHLAAALAQHFWFRTDVLRRMLGRA